MRPLRWGADASEDSGDDLISQGEQGSDGARGREQEVWALLTRYQLAPSPTGCPYGIPPGISRLAAVPTGAAEGVNDFG